MPSEVAVAEPQARAITYAGMTAPPQVFVDTRKCRGCTTAVYATFDPNALAVTTAPVLITYPTELRREIRPHGLRAPIVYVPPRRERPRERRAAVVRRQGRAPTSDDPSPSPDLEVRSYARFRRDFRRALGAA
jgi:hypothetical protein